MLLTCQAEGGEVTEQESTIAVTGDSRVVGIVVNFEFEGMVGFEGEL